jgi:hypothetical protein
VSAGIASAWIWAWLVPANWQVSEEARNSFCKNINIGAATSGHVAGRNKFFYKFKLDL